MTVRAAREDDAPRLAVLATQLGYPTDAAAALTRLRDLRAHDHGEVLVAVDETDLVIAWTHVFVVRSLESAPHAEIAGFVVDETCRGRGIGGRLLQAVDTWAAERGFPHVRVRSNVVRVDAHRFYLERGYSAVKTQTVFRHDVGQDVGGAAST